MISFRGLQASELGRVALHELHQSVQACLCFGEAVVFGVASHLCTASSMTPKQWHSECCDVL